MNIKGFQIVGTAFRLLLVITVRYIVTAIILLSKICS